MPAFGFVAIAICLLLQAILGIALLGHVSHEHPDRGVFGWSVTVAAERRAVAARAASESVSSSGTAHVDLLRVCCVFAKGS
jgi:hypothetical protein